MDTHICMHIYTDTHMHTRMCTTSEQSLNLYPSLSTREQEGLSLAFLDLLFPEHQARQQQAGENQRTA